MVKGFLQHPEFSNNFGVDTVQQHVSIYLVFVYTNGNFVLSHSVINRLTYLLVESSSQHFNRIIELKLLITQ